MAPNSSQLSSYVASCCGSNESHQKLTFARAFEEFSGADRRLNVRGLHILLETVFARRFTPSEVSSLAKRVGSYTVYSSLQRAFGETDIDLTLSFEECEYIYQICLARGYVLRSAS